MPIPNKPQKTNPPSMPEKQADKPKTASTWNTPGTPKPEPVKKPGETGKTSIGVKK